MQRSSVRVEVPATSANLGPGFDSLGLALKLHDVVEVEPAADGLELTVAGVGRDDLPRDESHLVIRAMRAAFDEIGERPPGLRVRCTNAIPHGRGLGSSAAAIVAGVLAARSLTGAPMAQEHVLALAARLEGHPDNVAPCLLGGFTISWGIASGVRAVSLPVHPDVRPTVFLPPGQLSTETARGLLPASVPHGDAARNAGRAALLVEALSRRPDLLFDATEDLLHQSYREPAMGDSMALVRALRDAGAPAVISGAGPSVVVLGAPVDEALVPPGWRAVPLAVDVDGATTTRSEHEQGNDAIANGHRG